MLRLKKVGMCLEMLGGRKMKIIFYGLQCKTYESVKTRIVTLYLSTIGNLTGPSLDLLKFGKLSKCGIKGKPLK